MKKYVIALLALTIMMITSFSLNAGSPEQCKQALADVLGKLKGNEELKKKGVTFTGGLFWTLPDKEICDFKRQANAAGLWAQFAQVCNSMTPEECKTCKCGRDDFTNATACSLKCGHCWNPLGPCFQAQ